MPQSRKPGPTSLKPKALGNADAAKVRGGDTVTLKKLPGKRKPPTLTLK
jgi:hypothetical protein